MHMDDLKGLTYDELVFSTLLGKVRAATIESGDDGWRADPRVHQVPQRARGHHMSTSHPLKRTSAAAGMPPSPWRRVRSALRAAQAPAKADAWRRRRLYLFSAHGRVS